MLSDEQFADLVMKHSTEISALQENTKALNQRLNENKNIAEGINKLALSVGEMAIEIKHLTTRVDASIGKIEGGQKAQGERIGNIEKTIMLFERNEKNIEEHEKRLDAIEKAPGHKWDKLGWIVIGGIVTAVVAFMMARIL
jgi:methyl-accepting chemotaxis protein